MPHYGSLAAQNSRNGGWFEHRWRDPSPWEVSPKRESCIAVWGAGNVDDFNSESARYTMLFRRA